MLRIIWKNLDQLRKRRCNICKRRPRNSKTPRALSSGISAARRLATSRWFRRHLSSIRKGFGILPNGTCPPCRGRITCIRFLRARPILRWKIWRKFTRLSAMFRGWRMFAAPILARRFRPSVRRKHLKRCTSRIIKKSIIGFISTRPGKRLNIPAARSKNSCRCLSNPASTLSIRCNVPPPAWTRTS